MIARGTEEENEVLWVEIRHDGVVGRGEAAPIPRYEESAQSALAYAQEAAGALGDDPFALEEIMARLPRARVRGARRDRRRVARPRRASCSGRPVYQLLGLPRAGPPTSWTIWLGEPDDMARRAERVRGRFKRLKLKLGGGDGQDVERVRAVREVADAPLQVDVNEAWTLDEALDALPQLAELGVEYCEQPLPAGRPAGPAVKAAFADPDLRRRGLPHARATSRPARSGRTASTSSSRSRAASARRCAWCTPRARSISAACSAA